MPPGLVEAATALVVDGNPQPARDWLEQTQEIPNFSAFGVYRRDGGQWRPTSELSVKS